MTVSEIGVRDYAAEALAAEAALHAAPSVVDVIAIRATVHPDDVALFDVARGTRLTYGELQDRSGSVAARLADAGVRGGDILALPVDVPLVDHAVVHHAAYLAGARPMVVRSLADLVGRPVTVDMPGGGAFRLLVVDPEHVGCAEAAAREDAGDALYDERSRTAVPRTGAELRQVFAPGWPKLLPMLRDMAYTVDPASFGSVLLWQYWRGRGGYAVTGDTVEPLVAAAAEHGVAAIVLTKPQYRTIGAATPHDMTAVREVDITCVTRVTPADNERVSAVFPEASPAAAPALDGRLRLLAARTGGSAAAAAAVSDAEPDTVTPMPPTPAPPLPELVGDVGAAYLELLIGVLTRWTFDHEYVPVADGLYRKVGIDRLARAIGRDWPADAETMVGVHRLRHLAACVAQVVADGVPGDLLEAGVWRGGSCMVMRAVLRAMGNESRQVWAADSYQGFPEQDFTLAASAPATDTAAYRFPLINVGLPLVRRNFERFGLLDDRVRFVPGWFHETLPGLDVGQLALLRLDGDLYDSTWAPLAALYPKLAPGGFCVVDDYGDVTACRAAVDEFRAANGITEPIEWIDTDAVYWRKAR